MGTEGYDPVAVARASLAQALAYRPSNDADRRTRDANIARLEAYLASREDHPSNQGPAA